MIHNKSLLGTSNANVVKNTTKAVIIKAPPVLSINDFMKPNTIGLACKRKTANIDGDMHNINRDIRIPILMSLNTRKPSIAKPNENGEEYVLK